MPQGDRPTLLDDFNHRFVVFKDYEVRHVVFGPCVGVIPTRVEVNVVTVVVEGRFTVSRGALFRRSRGFGR